MYIYIYVCMYIYVYIYMYIYICIYIYMLTGRNFRNVFFFVKHVFERRCLEFSSLEWDIFQMTNLAGHF